MAFLGRSGAVWARTAGPELVRVGSLLGCCAALEASMKAAHSTSEVIFGKLQAPEANAHLRFTPGCGAKGLVPRENDTLQKRH